MLRPLALVLLIPFAATAQTDWPAPEAPRLPARPVPLIISVADEKDIEPAASPLADFHFKLKKLKEERDLLKDERTKTLAWLDDEPASGTEIAKLQQRLGGLLTYLAAVKKGGSAEPPPRLPAPRKTEIEPPKTTTPQTPLPIIEEPITKKQDKTDVKEKVRFSHVPDPLTLAHALFKAGNYADALYAYRLVPLDGLTASERVPVKYMIATCLKKQGKTEEAAGIFREIANSPGDEQLAACAQWQLGAMRWHKDLQEQLERVRQRRQALEKSP
jgi:hypothetical protein